MTAVPPLFAGLDAVTLVYAMVVVFAAAIASQSHSPNRRKGQAPVIKCRT